MDFLAFGRREEGERGEEETEVASVASELPSSQLLRKERRGRIVWAWGS